MPRKRDKNKTSITAFIDKKIVYDFTRTCVYGKRCRTDILATLMKAFVNDVNLQYDIIEQTPKSIFYERTNNAKQA